MQTFIKLATTLALAALAACSGGTGTATETADTTTDDATGSTGPTTTTSPTTGGPGAALVVLNEVSSGGALSGPYAGKGDLIELYNAGDAQADLSGFRLSDDMTFPADKTFVFADGLFLAPGGWLVLTEQSATNMDGNFPFGLSQTNAEMLLLADGDGNVVDSIGFDGADAAVSYCRVPDGDGAWQKCDQTFSEANASASNTCGDGVVGGLEQCDGEDDGGVTCNDLGFMGGAFACTSDCKRDTSSCVSGSMLVINELEAVNDDIELFNAGDAPVDLAGFILTDDVSGPDYDPMQDAEKLEFDPQTIIEPQGFLIVPKGALAGQHLFGLSGDGETVTLLRPDQSVADQVTYGPGDADVSYCRLPDGPDGAWTANCNKTIGAPNMQ